MIVERQNLEYGSDCREVDSGGRRVARHQSSVVSR